MIPTIVNQGGGKWAFEKLANILSESLWVDVKDNFGDMNYILVLEKEQANDINSFIPIKSIKIASDKRKIAERFNAYDVNGSIQFWQKHPNTRHREINTLTLNMIKYSTNYKYYKIRTILIQYLLK